jgi:hypothetical protein
MAKFSKKELKAVKQLSSLMKQFKSIDPVLEKLAEKCGGIATRLDDKDERNSKEEFIADACYTVESSITDMLECFDDVRTHFDSFEEDFKSLSKKM